MRRARAACASSRSAARVTAKGRAFAWPTPRSMASPKSSSSNIASENADNVIVTDDNPRSEDPDAIRAAILSAAKGAKDIGDRAAAIRIAIDGLQPGDALLIAGKGHETGQIVGDHVLPFSDHDAVASALAPRVA